jgi:hypothetical protein
MKRGRGDVLNFPRVTVLMTLIRRAETVTDKRTESRVVPEKQGAPSEKAA